MKMKGAIWNTLGSMMYGANSFIMLALVSRVGTVEQAGCFGIAFTTAQILYIIGLFGVSHYQMTDYTETYSFSNYAHVRLYSCILMTVCCDGAILLLGFTGTKAVYTAGLTLLMLLNAVGDLYQSMFFQMNRLDLSGAALFYRTFWPLLIFGGVLLSSGHVLAAIAAQTAASLIVTCYYAGKVAPQLFAGRPSQRPSGSDAALMRECFPLFLSLFLMNLIANSSKYGVEFWLDDQAQGYYSMIFIPFQAINLCSQFIFKPFLNGYAELLHRGENRQFLSLLKKQILLIAALTAVCCLCAYWLGTPALGFLYHKDLSPFTAELTLVILGGGIFAVCQLFYYVLVILRRQKSILNIYLASFAATAVFTAGSVKRHGLAGAAFSLILDYTLMLLLYAAVLRRVLGKEAHA